MLSDLEGTLAELRARAGGVSTSLEDVFLELTREFEAHKSLEQAA